MKKGKWKKFSKLTGICYESLVIGTADHACWDKAFEILREIVADGRSERAEYAAELYQLDEMTDYEYDVQGWLEDYLDELDMCGDKKTVLKVCDVLLDLFQWKEDNPSEIKLMKATALSGLGEHKKAVDFCRHWLETEADNIAAVTASVYAYLAERNMEEAEKLIQAYIPEGTQCTDENDILFIAAAAYYKASGNEKKWERINDALEAYEQYIEEFDWEEDALPFY